MTITLHKDHDIQSLQKQGISHELTQVVFLKTGPEIHSAEISQASKSCVTGNWHISLKTHIKNKYQRIYNTCLLLCKCLLLDHIGNI